MTTKQISLLQKDKNREISLGQKTLSVKQQQTVDDALSILSTYLQRMEYLSFTSSKMVRSFLQLKLACKENEVFACLFLDSQHRLIVYREIFVGTIHICTVYPRVVVKQALHYNASALILAHNHPSGLVVPSLSDRNLTDQLVRALALIDVNVLDHFIVGESNIVSFADCGIL